ncbi:MAG: NHL repeat-containing protein [Defluviitaleaceae bacterium]|nr:NHL repeat-containing protein [Defluviitaleaceae bacterium]
MKRILAISLFLLAAVILAVPVAADTPYQGYTYDYWGRLVPAPAAYVPVRTFVASDICPTLGEFNEPSDIHVAPCETIIYIVDRGNNRIIGFDNQLNLIRVIDAFTRDGEADSFSNPNSIFVTPSGHKYIADTNNHRIVVLDGNGNFLRQITEPDVEELEDDFAFLPEQVLVGRSGRVLVIVQRVYEGMMMFSPEGDFLGYFGSIPVNASPLELLWRNFQTREQRAIQARIIPTEFQSMALDSYGFVLTTNIQPWGTNDQVMRLNPRGGNVIENFNDNVGIDGDQWFRPAGGWLTGPSQFIDIIARPYGKFSTLDSTRGRVYTYDAEGNLLYVFSGIGTLHGMTNRPVAIEMLGENIMILDAGRGRVVYFEPTEYGRLVNSAIAARHRGDEEDAVHYWRRLVSLDENFALAWAGIGRSMLASGDNVAAMYYLYRGMDMQHYSIAFRRHRIDVMHEALPAVLTVGIVLIAIVAGLRILVKVKGYQTAEDED